MTEREAEELIQRYKKGECTPDERAMVTSWYLSQEDATVADKDIYDYEGLKKEMWDKVIPKHKSIYYRPVAAAAAIIFLLATSYLYFIYNKPGEKQDLYTYNKAHDIPAGSNQAILTLADGKQIALDSNTSGRPINSVIQTDGIKTALPENTYNTITTPNGGQYQVILPDGSSVTLNAASSLKYPVKFASHERRVIMTGEGYFMVTKDSKKPFIVTAANQTVKVLGTHFNINAYEAGTDPVRTTLEEGRVLVTLSPKELRSKSAQGLTSLSNRITLKPGEQAINTGKSLEIKAVNLQSELSWKDGLFVFEKTTINTVLHQISRWYDVEVDYDNMPDKAIYGAISRDVPLSEMLRMIEKTSHVNLKLEGRRIIIKK